MNPAFSDFAGTTSTTFTVGVGSGETQIELVAALNTKMANPMTALGDVIAGSTSGTPVRVAGNTATTNMPLVSQGTGSAAQTPSFKQLASGDLSDHPWTSLTGTTNTFQVDIGGAAVLQIAGNSVTETGADLYIENLTVGDHIYFVVSNATSGDTTAGSINGDGSTTWYRKHTFAASAAGYAAFNIPPGAAVTSPNDGDAWYDGTHFYFRHSGTTTDLLAGGGGGPTSAVSINVAQASHGFSTGNAVYYNGSAYVKAEANASTTLGLGVVTVTDANNFVFYMAGQITGLSGLTAGQYYFVSDATPGALTTTEPTASTSYSNPILLALSTTSGIVLPFRPSQVPAASNNGDMLAIQINSEHNMSSTGALSMSTWNHITNTSANFAVTLPAVASNWGKFVGIIIDRTSTFTVAITGNASETIDGTNTRIMWADETAVLYADQQAGEWVKVAGRTIPMMSCLGVAGNQTFANSTETLLTFSGSVYNYAPAAMQVTASYKLVALRPGKYRVGLSADCAPGNTSGCVAILQVYKNGATYLAQADINYTSNSNAGGCISREILLALNDYIQPYGYYTAGSFVTTYLVNDSGSWTHNQFSLCEVPTW